MNTAILTGNIGTDVELKTTQSGKSVCSFNLAVKDSFNKDHTDWITIVCWNKTAELVAQYTKKGSKIGVDGRISTRSYEDKQGNKRTAFEVVANSVEFLDSKKSDSDTPTYSSVGQFNEVDGDDLPF